MKKSGGDLMVGARRFMDASELWSVLDGLTRKILGVDAATFAQDFARGRFEDTSIARDLGVFLRFAEPPSDMAPQ
jgi:hypothetical protein